MATLKEIQSGKATAQQLLDQLDSDITNLTAQANGISEGSGRNEVRRIRAIYQQLSQRLGEPLDAEEVFE